MIMNKKYAVVALVIVLILIIAALLSIYFQDPLKKCIKQTRKELKEQKTQYLEGNLIVNFRDDILKEEAKNIISIYGFNISYLFPSSNSALVKVPRDREIEAICMLNNDTRIVSTELNIVFNLT